MPVANNHNDDQEIWSAFRMGDQQAYSMIYERYFNALFNYGYKIAREKEMVKDCIHDLFVEIWHSRQQLGEPASVKNYLLKCIRNKIIRKRKYNKDVSEDQAHEMDFQIVLSRESVLIHDQLLQEKYEFLKSAIQQLTPRQKEAIYLMYYDNLNPQEIAEIMSLKPKTIYNIINSGIQSLRNKLRKPNVITWLTFLFF